MFFSLLLFLVLGFITLILLSLYHSTKKKIIIKLSIGIWIVVGLFAILIIISNFLYSKRKLDKEDFYGTYIVNREFFKGKNADWQYNHYRFEITKDNVLNLYITDESKVLKIYRRKIEFIEGSVNPHLKIINENPNFILESEPTLYSSSWGFYLVFKTKPYSNMFFKKGKWKSINN
ncbi:hypothetical protein [Epilithonimonas zeae]|uniref:hypothetical protein n=1 Tax=Epilithonimonas zeae TaxID=1416779 RepID=UPI00200CFAC9|nr:hypothetical protein [Epilithonimonas zeae]UQB67341.1 hypothetical protein KI430_09815 [Epilithonimonas zeae]